MCVDFGWRTFLFYGVCMKFNRVELDKINIYILRTVAREVGVKSPTSLTKQALIEEILQIQSGIKKPCTPSKRGRPVKNSLENQNYEGSVSIRDKEAIKKEFIDKILKEIENRLYDIL